MTKFFVVIHASVGNVRLGIDDFHRGPNFFIFEVTNAPNVPNFGLDVLKPTKRCLVGYYTHWLGIILKILRLTSPHTQITVHMVHLRRRLRLLLLLLSALRFFVLHRPNGAGVASFV